jgi:predicted CXXCH cytochrome family protein
MRTTIITIIVLVVVFIIFFTQKRALHSEQLEHHGQLVQVEADLNDCIVCHDGTIAPNSAYCTVKCNCKSPHSVLKDYPPRGKENQYLPISALEEKGIRLFNGKITCVSCHDLTNPEKYHLVISNSESRLCFSCHIK